MKILIRGAGDLATGIAAELWERGYQILMTDVAIPLTVSHENVISLAACDRGWVRCTWSFIPRAIGACGAQVVPCRTYHWEGGGPAIGG